MRYLITGGAGFIGSNLARALVKKRNAEVAILDNFATGSLKNLQGICSKIQVIRADLRNAAAVTRAVRKGDIIFHQAALPSVQRSVEDPKSSLEVGVTGTLNLLMAAVKKKAKRVVFASSSSVYGNLPGLPKKENAPLNPLSPYAASKASCEGLMQAFYASYGLETVCLRYFNVFGPYQDPDSEYSAVIPKFITLMAAGKNPVIFGDGLQSRDFTYIDNVVHGNLLAAKSKKAAGTIMNLSCGATYSVKKLLQELNSIMGTKSRAQFKAPRSGEVRHSYANISLAKKTLQYKVKVDFRQGLEKTVSFFTQ